ncbi:hypothetical protein FSP39_021556, partial [Pinctada imbricata]
DFDTTLIITLLRNLSNILTPSLGWNKDPHPSDSSLGADLLRLRRIRNDHVHCKNMRMTNKDFGKKWSDLTMNSTPLLLATLNNHTKVCELLLDNGADVNIANQNGYDPILVASRNGNTKLIHLYFHKGAHINSQSNPDENTPLHLAAMMGNKRATKYLLANGADTELKNIEGFTPFVLATYRKQNEIAGLLYDFRMFGLQYVALRTPSVESPHTSTSLDSSDTSSNHSPFSVTKAAAELENKTRPSLAKVPSRRSIASSSASSIVYSDKGSLQSSFDSFRP